MTLDLKRFRIAPGETVRLADRPTRIEAIYDGKAGYRRRLAKRVKAIADLQRVLYADRRSALLVVLQASDAAGKDGAIRHVFSGVNPQGCQVTSFGPPSTDELAHDFLWRTTLKLPPRGYIGVFNRSYYEEVLALRARPDLLKPEAAHFTPTLWHDRYQAIVGQEQHLVRSGTRILKIYLHLSRDEQRRRFLSRIAEPQKHWKLSPSDIADRPLWDDYQQAYEACFTATSHADAPWLILPADDKKTARILVAEAVRDTLRAIDPAYPTTSPEREAELQRIRGELEAEAAPAG